MSEFDLQPTLNGSLIALRPLAREDFDALFAAASDPLIWQQHPESDRYTPEVFQRYFDGAMASRGALAIIERRSGRIIGSSRFLGFEPRARQVEIGFTFIERAFWGGRYNAELKKLMVDHAMQFVDRILFVVGEKNHRSQKAVQKLGASFVQSIDPLDRNGMPRKSLVFALTRAFWESRSP